MTTVVTVRLRTGPRVSALEPSYHAGSDVVWFADFTDRITGAVFSPTGVVFDVYQADGTLIDPTITPVEVVAGTWQITILNASQAGQWSVRATSADEGVDVDQRSFEVTSDVPVPVYIGPTPIVAFNGIGGPSVVVGITDIPGAVEDIEVVGGAAGLAAAEPQRILAQTAAVAAESAAAQAAAALSDAAGILAAGAPYATKAAGLAATATNGFFYARPEVGDADAARNLVVLYQNVAGVATERDRLFNKSAQERVILGTENDPVSQAVDPKPFLNALFDANGKLLAFHDRTTGALDTGLTAATMLRVAASFGMDDYGTRVQPASQAIDPSPFIDAITDAAGYALSATGWNRQVEFEPGPLLAAKIIATGPTPAVPFAGPETVTSYTGSYRLTLHPNGGAITLEDWEGATYAAYQRVGRTTRLIQSAQPFPCLLAGGQSNNGPVPPKWTIAPFSPLAVMFDSNQGNQITGGVGEDNNPVFKLSAVGQPDFRPNADSALTGGHVFVGFLGVAFAAQQIQQNEPLTGAAVFSSYRGGSLIDKFVAQDGDITGNYTWTNSRTASQRMGELALLYNRKPYAPFYSFDQGENYGGEDWRTIAEGVLDAEVEAQRVTYLALSGVDYRPHVILAQTYDSISQTNPTGVAAHQYALAKAHMNGTTTMTAKVSLYTKYQVPISSDNAIHEDAMGKCMRAELVAWIGRRTMATNAVVPMLDIESIAYTEGATTMRLTMTNPTALPGGSNVQAWAGQAIKQDTDWLEVHAPVGASCGFAFENGGGVTVTAVTFGGQGNNWIDLTLSGSLPAPGARLLTYGYTPNVRPFDGPTNWSTTRGTICVDTDTRSWFRQKWGWRMGVLQIPEFIRIYMVRSKRSF